MGRRLCVGRGTYDPVILQVVTSIIFTVKLTYKNATLSITSVFATICHFSVVTELSTSQENQFLRRDSTS